MSEHTAEFSLSIAFDEGGCADAKATVTFDFTPGTPESGRFGPPENYDCGSPAEISVAKVMLAIGYGEFFDAPWAVQIIEADDDLLAAMETAASEELDGWREEAMERRADDARERLREAD